MHCTMPPFPPNQFNSITVSKGTNDLQDINGSNGIQHSNLTSEFVKLILEVYCWHSKTKWLLHLQAELMHQCIMKDFIHGMNGSLTPFFDKKAKSYLKHKC